MIRYNVKVQVEYSIFTEMPAGEVDKMVRSYWHGDVRAYKDGYTATLEVERVTTRREEALALIESLQGGFREPHAVRLRLDKLEELVKAGWHE